VSAGGCVPAETKKEALDDLRQAAHFGIDTVLDITMGEPGLS
jgi:hypothetical protein